jgi:ectoine hydroxylase-related dioxygenase (phytanoyl-CoA dioxygenase family)
MQNERWPHAFFQGNLRRRLAVVDAMQSRVEVRSRMGSVVLFNNQVWHRGAPNTSSRTRVMTQITYARRFVGHKYFPFMNYQMPEHVYEGANPRLKRLLGFLPSGNYG